ncbi:60S ribosomal protein L24, putative [Plasmodium knowlesi strain H]|uniref:60S ribosomal protein L24, putative n=3 Tax=Plasmodium knowlesi TaxID=5850 RepID=A0A5K1ULW9_PLAKH|nr:60S ribosomal protein L24, putative [Plasmodium knowlesi strain H]OTN63864.1 putative 60S ribosomal protein L24 [Plasmodium knowlesi]CAA9990694.1 60S ribosomal protein L24, putative [Plasmodium knowlesi strain H]SBO25911.1 60S ribosomal protein L24, putative [Plasmodium knowlesi strain H]SBO28664.1 60S ribosomal protein L24, putative [Plasmodium knowlesi strain H]VVS80168.1 60S ribosomal protein L24, putative [Plasmodium knowlesi strain H]|eukprot:XP_002261984.1 60S ribosomal protein L24, putative [Plasmodium knowlesi strain H]
MSSIKTTVKTEACSFSEYRIYPGRGQKFIARDGKVYFYLSSKFASLALQKKKAAKLRWTQTWRRNNKKTKIETTQRRRYKKTIKVQKAVCGLTVEDIRNRKAYVQSIEAKNKSRMAGKEKDDKKKGKDDKKKNALQFQQKKDFSKSKQINMAKTKMHKMMKK